MSIEKITSKILSQADAEKEEILGKAKGKSDAILKEASEKASALISESEKRGADEKEKIISRRQSVAGIDSRKVILARKQELINQCFELATEKLATLKEEDYLKLLVGLGTASGVKSGLLIFNEKDKAAIGQKLADELNKSEGADFKVADETRDIKGGYILVSGQTFVNNTMEALVEEYRGDLTSKVAEILFEED